MTEKDQDVGIFFFFFVLPKISDNSIHDSFSDVYGVDNNCDMILFS
jgi:hypothetical protein